MQTHVIDPAALIRLRRRQPLADVVSIPGDWMQRAATLPGKALQTAVAIASLAATYKTHTIDLSPQSLARFGLQPKQAHRALTILVRSGLVSAQRCQRRAPRVTLIGRGHAGLAA
ncbi:hypothetical protein SAMN04488038_10789 [Solimonas aquatica]|uniref:Helix-turn-helix domain-containing protein n=1 Tax=Solimonas aquatica TaxID=489703 RepID=A0A1H9GIY5_9GAMM|nr:hypothetical protein [Solimonas aquatica]SEQ49983.1 hypothetical protein SAMN04488038_10789 [Solimonas aquatica]